MSSPTDSRPAPPLQVDDERDRLKREVLVVEDRIEVERKERESERKVVDDLVRERDILNKNLVKMVSATQAQADVLKIHENSKRNLEVEIASYRSATLATARTVKKLRRSATATPARRWRRSKSSRRRRVR